MIKIGEMMWNLWIYLECQWNTIKFCWPSSNSKRGGLTDICSWFSVGICLVDWSFVTTKINTSLKLGIKTILGTSHFSKKGCTNQIIICESFPYQPKRKRMMRALISRTHLYLQSWDLQWLTFMGAMSSISNVSSSMIFWWPSEVQQFGGRRTSCDTKGTCSRGIWIQTPAGSLKRLEDASKPYLKTFPKRQEFSQIKPQKHLYIHLYSLFI